MRILPGCIGAALIVFAIDDRDRLYFGAAVLFLCLCLLYTSDLCRDFVSRVRLPRDSLCKLAIIRCSKSLY